MPRFEGFGCADSGCQLEHRSPHVVEPGLSGYCYILVCYMVISS